MQATLPFPNGLLCRQRLRLAGYPGMEHSIIHTGHCHSCEQGQGEMQQQQRIAALLCQCQICARAAWHTRKHLVRRLKSFLTRTKTPDASNGNAFVLHVLLGILAWNTASFLPLSPLQARQRGNCKNNVQQPLGNRAACIKAWRRSSRP